MTVSVLLEQPCNKSDSPTKLVVSCKQLVPNLLTTWERRTDPSNPGVILFRVSEKRVIPQALEVSDNTADGLRRSQRNRVPCLQYWKNERIEYERRQSGIIFCPAF